MASSSKGAQKNKTTPKKKNEPGKLTNLGCAGVGLLQNILMFNSAHFIPSPGLSLQHLNLTPWFC